MWRVEVGQDLAKECTRVFHQPVGRANCPLQLHSKPQVLSSILVTAKYGCLEYRRKLINPKYVHSDRYQLSTFSVQYLIWFGLVELGTPSSSQLPNIVISISVSLVYICT